MAANNGELFKEYRRLLDNREIPENLSRAALWGAVAVIYEDLKPLKGLAAKSDVNRKWLRVLTGFAVFFVLIHLPDVLAGADMIWKLLLTLL